MSNTVGVKYNKQCKETGNMFIKAIVMYMAVCVASEVIYPAAAQVFAPIPSCTSELSSLAGIVCSGDAVTGKVLHCVLNEHFQAGLVCTKWSVVTAGRCPQYITQFSWIDDFACIGNECPRVIYRSYEVYKYPACLNSSLYITEPSATSTETTPESTLSTVRECGEDSSKQSTCAAPIAMCGVMGVIVCILCIIIVWECYTGKPIQQVIRSRLENGSHDHKKTNGSPELQERSAAERNSFLIRESEGVKVLRWSQERLR